MFMNDDGEFEDEILNKQETSYVDDVRKYSIDDPSYNFRISSREGTMGTMADSHEKSNISSANELGFPT